MVTGLPGYVKVLGNKGIDSSQGKKKLNEMVLQQVPPSSRSYQWKFKSLINRTKSNATEMPIKSLNIVPLPLTKKIKILDDH